MFDQEPAGYDIIGDIHGHCDELTALLKKLGYFYDGASYRHSNRKAIFVGDLIDRGPKIRETLALVKAMHAHDQALVILGNHEYNAVCYSTRDEREGMFLRAHTPKNNQQFQATASEFGNFSLTRSDLREEWEDYVRWFSRLPLYLDMGDFRVAHACWSQSHIEILGDNRLSDYDFLIATVMEDPSPTPEFLAVETVLKGPEMPLPNGHSYFDKDGHKRTKMRVKWWSDLSSASLQSLSFPRNESLPDDLLPDDFAPDWDPYPCDAPPVFVGHYWLPPQTPRPFGNVICLDYSVAKGGFLCAYQWNSGELLDKARFVTHAASRSHPKQTPSSCGTDGDSTASRA